MKRTKLTHLLLGLSLILLTGCSAHLLSTKVPSSPASGSKSDLDGLFYTLPQTVVTVKVPFSVTKVAPGKYAIYKDLFFPGTKAASPKTAIGTPELSVRGITDPRQVYVVKATGRGALQQTLTFGFREDGVVTGARADVENVTGDLVLSGFKGLVGIATRTLLTGGAAMDTLAGKSEAITVDCDQERKEVKPQDRWDFFVGCVLAEEEHGQRHQGQLAINFLDHENRDDQERWVNHYFDNSKYFDFLRAMATHRQIYGLVQGHHDALRVADGGPKQDVILAKNEARVARLMQQFTGVKQKLDWTGHFDLLPPECDADRATKCTATWTSQSLISYTPNDGMCGYLSANHRGKAPSPKMDAGNCAMKQDLVLTLEPNSVTDQLAFRLAENFTLPAEAGLYFIVPLNVSAQLIDRKTSGASEPVQGSVELAIAQRGILAALPSKIGGKAFTHDIKYYESSGALKSYVLVSKPLVDKGAVDSLSGSLNELLDARNKQRETEANAGLEALKRETEAVELRLRRQKACAELSNPPDECGNL